MHNALVQSTVNHLVRTQNGQPLIVRRRNKVLYLFPFVLVFELEFEYLQDEERPFQSDRGGTCTEASCCLWNVQEVANGLGSRASSHIMAWLCHSLRRWEEGSWATLKCSVCSKFTASIREQRNFSDRWSFSADSVLANMKYHAQWEQHIPAMQLLKKGQGRAAGMGVSSYAPYCTDVVRNTCRRAR